MTNAIKSVSEVQTFINIIKSANSNYLTNFYVTTDKIEKYIDQKNLMVEYYDGVTFFLRKDLGFYRVNFYAKSLDNLEQAVRKILNIKKQPLVLDIIGEESNIAPTIELFKSNGFKIYQRLVRMTLTHCLLNKTRKANQDIIKAAFHDAKEILELFLKFFDPIAEQIPILYEIENAIILGQIWIKKIEKKIIGLLFYETKGKTSLLRYWLVSPKYRRQGIGEALMSIWFQEHLDIQRFLLWVRVDNTYSMYRYSNYGFKPNKLEDFVLVKI
ncbi:MAG: GNAT family N-acetyltransferase [Pseudomonadota bacterium]